MELNLVLIRPYIPVIIAVLPMITAIVIFVDTRYAYETSFEKFKTENTIATLENRRLILESKIYFLESCRISSTCPRQRQSESEIAVATRELQATKELLDTFNNRK